MTNTVTIVFLNFRCPSTYPNKNRWGGEGGAYFILLSLEGVLIGRVIYCKAFFAQCFSNVVTAELMGKCTCKCSKVLGGGEGEG